MSSAIPVVFVVLYSASVSVYLLPPLTFSSKPSRFLRCPAIYPVVRPACHHHISVNPEFLSPFDSHHLRNILSLQPSPPPLTHFLSPFSLSHSIYISISPQPLSLSASYSLSQSILLNCPLSHYLFSLSLYFLTLCLTHTHSLTYPGSPPPPSPLCPATKSIAELSSSHLQQLTGYTGMMVSALYCSIRSDRLGSDQFGSSNSVLICLSLLWTFYYLK